MQKYYLIVFSLLLSLHLSAQSTFISYNRDYYHLIDRFDILYANKNNTLQTSYKPLRRIDLAHFLQKLDSSQSILSPIDQYNFEYLYNDNWEFAGDKYNENQKSWWNLAYNKKSDFLYFDEKNFTMRINPVIHFSVGSDNQEEEILFTNTRGIEAQGTIDNKIGFYTFLSTTQLRVPQYIAEYVSTARAYPYEGFYKIDDKDKNLFDIFHARGYFTFNLTKSIDVQAGYDKQFIGNGIRSMVLSDFSSPMLFGKINTRLGPFQYTNLWAELTEDIIFSGGGSPDDGQYPKKFMALHRLGLDVTPNLNIGVYETIISDSVNINYFNPIIFYRAIEQNQGSPDNILIGLDFQWNIKNRYQLYGQFMLDEFYIDALRAGDGDWRNKFGVQLGAKYINAFNIDQLDLKIEGNLARPYFYAYERPSLSYTNYRNPLAHPLGANLKEILVEIRYQPFRKVNLTGKLFFSRYGEDQNDLNYGKNPLKSTNDRIANTGNTIGQGVTTKNDYLELIASYSILHNLYFDWISTYRNLQSDLPSRTNSSFINQVSLRWNIARREHEF
jgi:hypothetical protein